MKIFIFCFLSLIYYSYGQKNIVTSKLRKEQYYISIENFPSWDTAKISFFKKRGKWYKAIQRKHIVSIDSAVFICRECSSVFEKSFYDSLSSIKSEVNFEDCITRSDSIENGVNVTVINNFYASSDLEEEILKVKTINEPYIIKYFEPRSALNFCKNNIERLKFIYYANLLRSLK